MNIDAPATQHEQARAMPVSTLQRDETALIHHWMEFFRGGEAVLEQFGLMFPTAPISMLVKNEGDDGRPILLEKHLELPGCYSVLGGKIDNIYDVLEKLDEEIFNT